MRPVVILQLATIFRGFLQRFPGSTGGGLPGPTRNGDRGDDPDARQGGVGDGNRRVRYRTTSQVDGVGAGLPGGHLSRRQG